MARCRDGNAPGAVGASEEAPRLEEMSSKSHHLRRAGLITAGVAVALLFFGLGALARLLVGPVSLGPFSGELADAISNSLPGLAVRYDDAALQWSRDEGRVNLVILGARVFDRSQRIIAQAPKAEIDLAAAPLLQGQVVVRRMALVGVQLTMVHTMDGALRLGVEGDRGQSDVLERLREALQSSKGSATSLTSFAVRKARLAFYDERTGLFVVAPQASLTVSTSGGKSAALAASVDADIEVSGHRAYLQARLTLPPDGQTVTGDISLHGFDVNALGENAKALAFLKPYALKADITGSFTLDQGSTHVRAVDFGVGAAGIVHGFGHPVHVKTLRLVGRYDGRTGRLLIDDGVLAGNEARAHLYGDGHLKFNSAGGLEKSSVDLTMDKIGVDMPGVMQRAMTLARIALQASYTPADNRIVIDKFLMFGGNLSASLTGEVDLFPGETPKIAVNGHIAPLDIANLLHYWPLQLGQGAREWIAANILGGTIGPIALKADIAAGALDLPVLPDGAINLSFPIANATVNYLQGLTPLTNMQGSATLTGDTFTATVTSAKIGPLALSGGSVTIPNLHVAGSPGNIVAHVDGALSDVLTLIDMPPLHYPTRFHIGTDSAKGQAAIDLRFHVPMVKDLSIDDVGIKIGGQVRGLALAVGDHEVTNGVANLAIDNSSLHLDGDIVMAGASLKASWDEAFAAKGPITTHITASGVLDDAARKKLNFHSGDFLKGPVNVDATLDGHRGSITKAAMAMDLTPATVTIGLINYKKPPGVSADVQVTAQFKDGAIAGTDITADGAGLQLQGQAGFGPGGTLAMLDFPIVRAGPQNDFSLHMNDSPGVGLKVSVTGRSADGTGLGRTDLTGKKADNRTSEPAQSGKHFEIEANLDRLVMRSGVTMAPFAFSTSGIRRPAADHGAVGPVVEDGDALGRSRGRRRRTRDPPAHIECRAVVQGLVRLHLDAWRQARSDCRAVAEADQGRARQEAGARLSRRLEDHEFHGRQSAIPDAAVLGRVVGRADRSVAGQGHCRRHAGGAVPACMAACSTFTMRAPAGRRSASRPRAISTGATARSRSKARWRRSSASTACSAPSRCWAMCWCPRRARASSA